MTYSYPRYEGSQLDRENPSKCMPLNVTPASASELGNLTFSLRAFISEQKALFIMDKT